MARQGLHQHRKFLRLSRTLGSAPLARGVLEMLWEPAYDSGDDFLGDGEDIAARCGWTGPSAELLTALLESEFIDEDEDRPGHYRIHDLFDHAPDGVAKRIQREAARLERGQTIHSMRIAAGKKGAEIRWKNSKRIANDGKRIANVGEVDSKFRTPPPTPTPSPSQTQEAAISFEGGWVERVWRHHQAVFGGKGHIIPPVERDLIEARLADGRSADELCKAIDGTKANAWRVRNGQTKLVQIMQSDDSVRVAMGWKDSPPDKAPPTKGRAPESARNWDNATVEVDPETGQVVL